MPDAVPSYEGDDDRIYHDDDLHLPGCFWWAVRFAGCSLLLYVLMFLAILAMAVVGLILY